MSESNLREAAVEAAARAALPSDIETCPKISIGGREWPIPRLVFKQNKIVEPILTGLMTKLAPVFGAMQMAGLGDPKAPPMTGEQVAAVINALSELETEDQESLARAVWTAMTRGTPGLAWNEFENLETGMDEIMGALPVIMEQTGFMKQSRALAAKEKAKNPGEADPSIGTG